MQASELKVLVIEDDDLQRMIVIEMLRALGVTSICDADNGKLALEIIHGVHERPIDLVICDLNMPEMDGLEFLRHLGREDHNISIVITSAVDSKLLDSVGRMTKMHGIKLLGTIEKPIMPDRLRSLISSYERSERQEKFSEDLAAFNLEDILSGVAEKQFEPYFQPKVEVKTGRLIGAEALVRWLRPQYGVVGPNAFIPLLEQSGNIDDLTFSMLEKSAAACRDFHDIGFELNVSVNLSLASLDDTNLANRIIQLVRNAGVDPQYITLEITESAAMTDVAAALENLARLRMNGFGLSIDDYGTGYASMQQLTRIAFTELKIDRSFVKDCADNKALRIVVESSIEMAHKLQVKSVAEGVETQQDWDTLHEMGCDMVQGYFVAKPMAYSEFRAFLLNQP